MQDKPLMVPFQAWHLLEITPREEQRSTVEAIDNFIGLLPYGQALLDLAVDNCAWTFFDNGEPIISSGVVFQFIGVGEAWSVFGEKFLTKPMRYKYVVYKCVKEELENLRSVQRVQSMCQSDFTIAQDWLRRLGMEHEGTLKQYYVNTGKDAELFGKILCPSQQQ